jgi:hypothetical protein
MPAAISKVVKMRFISKSPLRFFRRTLASPRHSRFRATYADIVARRGPAFHFAAIPWFFVDFLRENSLG